VTAATIHNFNMFEVNDLTDSMPFKPHIVKVVSAELELDLESLTSVVLPHATKLGKQMTHAVNNEAEDEPTHACASLNTRA
jgi:hypothetical protein